MSATTPDLWNELHTQRRHRLNYPSEHCVRFYIACVQQKPEGNRILDVGCGAGRHMRLARDLQLDPNPTGIDVSIEAVQQAAEYGDAHLGDFAELPFDSDTFDAVVAFGSIYYGTREDTWQAVAEIKRVLKPEGWACMTLRTERDWRNEVGRTIDVRTVKLELYGEPEDGMVMNFATPHDVTWLCTGVAKMGVELIESTSKNMQRLDSDWLVLIRK